MGVIQLLLGVNMSNHTTSHTTIPKQCTYCYKPYIAHNSKVHYCCTDCLFHDGYTEDVKRTCWNWISNSKPSFEYRGKKYKAAKYAYERYRKKVPAGYVPLYICGNNNCVNPKHIAMGTKSESVTLRNCLKLTKVETFTREQIERVESVALDIEKVKRIKQDNRPAKDICKEYNVTINAIYKIRNNYTWKND